MKSRTIAIVLVLLLLAGIATVYAGEKAPAYGAGPKMQRLGGRSTHAHSGLARAAERSDSIKAVRPPKGGDDPIDKIPAK